MLDENAFNDNIVPSWANDVFVSKGLGFMQRGVKWLIWDYFESQFSHMECTREQFSVYLGHFIDESIKNGHVEMAITVAREHFSKPRKVINRRPAMQSQLVEFEQKWVNCGGATNDELPVEYGAPMPPPRSESRKHPQLAPPSQQVQDGALNSGLTDIFDAAWGNKD